MCTQEFDPIEHREDSKHQTKLAQSQVMRNVRCESVVVLDVFPVGI